jgi:hypothetical protein
MLGFRIWPITRIVQTGIINWPVDPEEECGSKTAGSKRCDHA